MATGMRERTTNVGGIIKRIWYAMTGTTQGPELMSIDDTGKFKCVSEQITGLAGTGNRMVMADSSGNLSAGTTRQITMSGAMPTPTSTGISINGGYNGKIIMAYVSTQYGDGLQVTSAVVMITCGYNGDNFVATTVSSYGGISTYGVEFSQVGGILYMKSLNGASAYASFVYNK